MWNPNKVNLGRIKVGSKHTITFKYEGDNMEVERLPDGSFFIVPSCGCAVPHYIPENKTITVKYVANPIPKHLALKGETSYLSVKTVTAHILINGIPQKDILTFTADVHS